MTRKIIMSGGRDFTDWAAVYRQLIHYPEGTVLVHGGHRYRCAHRGDADCSATCRRWSSTDHIADVLGRALGFVVVVVEADWKMHGPAAGPLRNQHMVTEHSDAERAIVFDGGPGTRDFTGRAVRAHIPVYGGGRTDRVSLSAPLEGAHTGGER